MLHLFARVVSNQFRNMNILCFAIAKLSRVYIKNIDKFVFAKYAISNFIISELRMNHCELQALRKLLMIDVSEAAEHIGKVSARTWQYWESSRYKIPEDVIVAVKLLVQKRQVLLDQLKNKCEVALKKSQHYNIPYYQTFASFQEKHTKSDAVTWRIHQSVAAAILATLDIGLKDEIEKAV